MNDFKYIILHKTELQLINVTELLEFCAEPIRISKDNVHVYIKYKGSMPGSIQSLTTKSEEYTREQMLMYFERENWLETPYY